MANRLMNGYGHRYKITKQLIDRLPEISNCSNDKNQEISFITDRYSVQSCQLTCHAMGMLRKCGAVNDMWVNRIPQKHHRFFNRSRTDGEKRKCIRDYVHIDYDYIAEGGCSHCPQTCEETRFDLDLKMKDPSIAEDLISVRLYYPELEEQHQHQRLMYTWYDFITDLGGFVGIALGASGISLLEVLLFMLFASLSKIM